MHLLSVNVAQAEAITIGSATQLTGIGKQPVSGPVRIGRLGADGDFIGDTEHHGGADQAIYLYSQEDYDWWRTVGGREFPAGAFGENLTLSSYGAGELRVGDHFGLGDVVLEITGPRIPCATLATRVQDPAFVRRFADAGRPGAYARVLREGLVESGAAITKVEAPATNSTVVEISRLWHEKNRSRGDLERLLASPLAERIRTKVERWLADSPVDPADH